MGTDGDRVQERGFGASWVFSAMAKVNSGFQSVVDRVWHWWSRAPYYFQMDTLSTLLFGWLIFGVLVVLLAKFLYDKFIREDSDFADEDLQNSHSDDRNEPKLPTGGCLGPPPKISKKPTIVPDGPPDRISPPIATGGDPDAIRWINNLLVWFYEGSEGGPVLRNSWNDVLNEYTVGVALETGVLVEILEFFPQTPAPCLYNVIVDCGPTDDMTITCDLEQTLYLRVQTTRTQRDVTTESEYACAVRPLRGRLNIALQTYKCRTHAKFDGWPEVTMELEGIRNNATGLDEQQLQDVVMEVLTAALRKVCLDIDFTQKRTFPRFSRARSVPDRVMPVGYDALHQPHSASSAASVGIIGLNGKRLLVKVVKASGIGGELGVSQTYAVIEMDEPPQKFTTAPINDSTSPFWDEQFLFDLSDNTLELLFELYDKKDKRFLGLGIVGIEELVATPSQRQIIPLQSRPCENDHVSGSLTCEFLFLDRADLPDLTLRAGSGITSQSGGRFTPTNSSYEKPSDDDFSEGGNNFGAEASALKGFEGRHSGPLSQAMPIARPIIQASRKVARNPSGEYSELNGLSQPMHDPRLENPAGVSNSRDSGLPSFNSSSVPQVITSGPSNYSTSVDQASFTAESSTNTSTEININGSDADERSRSRNRLKTDFFGSLRRRFSRSKVRSKSVDPTSPAGIDMTLDRDPPGGRSVSVERSSRVIRSRGDVRNHLTEAEAHGLLTVPTGMRKSSTGNLGGDTGSTRSSLSGTSGLSSASTRTYINEASLLVVETLENGIIKHYLVPLSLQRKNKWRKKGTKLHIFNEHIFVAKHMSSSILCHVCNKTLGRRFGKQGYECRDCSFKCHKPCHIKTDIVCPNSTINSMDLVYVKDEKAERKKGLRIS